MVYSKTVELRRKMTKAPKPNSLILRSRKKSKSRRVVEEEEEDYDDSYCEKCGSGEYPDELLLCDKCDRGFHLFCLRPILVSVPKGSWFCPSCSDCKSHTSFPLIQTKIEDFFGIDKFSQDCQKKRRRSSSLVVSKKKRRLLPYNPSEDPNRRLEQMASLATALIAVGADFCNELTYVDGMAPRSANLATLEVGGVQQLPRDDIESLKLCNRMMERGECPPLMVVSDSQEGFTVEADRVIKDLTIITEYVGDVDYLKNRENDDGDSIMTLLHAADPSKTLAICPDKRSNIARFINGINNHTPDGKKKQNVKAIRCSVDGESRVLLVAIRDIKRGERLYYDYNGYGNDYPTEHFI